MALEDLDGEAEGEPELVAAPLELALSVPEELAVAEGVLEGLALLLELAGAAAAEAEPEELPEAGGPGEPLPVPDGLSGGLAEALWQLLLVGLPEGEAAAEEDALEGRAEGAGDAEALSAGDTEELRVSEALAPGVSVAVGEAATEAGMDCAAEGEGVSPGEAEALAVPAAVKVGLLLGVLEAEGGAAGLLLLLGEPEAEQD